jgi:hypothetical protein
MAEEGQTCGKGIAENSALPAKLSELTAALAGVLETHMKALDLTDENSRIEHDAYQRLAREHRKTASQLAAAAREMAGYRDLPMGRHDMEVMGSPEALGAFERYVSAKRELVALLQGALQQDEEILAMMQSGARHANSSDQR